MCLQSGECCNSFFFVSEKDEEESEKKEEPRDNSEETAGSVDKSSGPWNRSAPTQIPVAEIIGEFCSVFLFIHQYLLNQPFYLIFS